VSSTIPKLSIGLPVYNGEPYLSEALDGLLAQTFTDFELIISDNASTDATAEICRSYAARDPRVRYIRQQLNRGAAINHSVVLEEARAPYFKWVASDDRHEPGYLAACVAGLDEFPDAVLCHSETVVIDLDGTVLRTVRPAGLATSARPSERFRDIVQADEDDRVFEMYGVMRTEVVRATGGVRPYEGSDYTFIAAMALRGPFHRVNEPLFSNRVALQSRYLNGHLNYDPLAGGDRGHYRLRLAAEFSRLIARSSMPLGDKVRCFAILGDRVPRKLRSLATQVAGKLTATVQPVI
jgi:glycosyltransferase involved in cell wall biosynthesis